MSGMGCTVTTSIEFQGSNPRILCGEGTLRYFVPQSTLRNEADLNSL